MIHKQNKQSNGDLSEMKRAEEIDKKKDVRYS